MKIMFCKILFSIIIEKSSPQKQLFKIWKVKEMAQGFPEEMKIPSQGGIYMRADQLMTGLKKLGSLPNDLGRKLVLNYQNSTNTEERIYIVKHLEAALGMREQESLKFTPGAQAIIKQNVDVLISPEKFKELRTNAQDVPDAWIEPLYNTIWGYFVFMYLCRIVSPQIWYHESSNEYQTISGVYNDLLSKLQDQIIINPPFIKDKDYINLFHGRFIMAYKKEGGWGSKVEEAFDRYERNCANANHIIDGISAKYEWDVQPITVAFNRVKSFYRELPDPTDIGPYGPTIDYNPNTIDILYFLQGIMSLFFARFENYLPGRSQYSFELDINRRLSVLYFTLMKLKPKEGVINEQAFPENAYPAGSVPFDTTTKFDPAFKTEPVLIGIPGIDGSKTGSAGSGSGNKNIDPSSTSQPLRNDEPLTTTEKIVKNTVIIGSAIAAASLLFYLTKKSNK